MIAGLLSFATSKLGIAVLAGLTVLVVLAWVYLDGKAAGAASVTAAALAEAARRAAAAQKARGEVKHTPDAIDQDEFNRDRK